MATAGSRPQDPPAGGRSLSKAFSDGMRTGTLSVSESSLQGYRPEATSAGVQDLECRRATGLPGGIKG
jgi:hypothetical protein